MRKLTVFLFAIVLLASCRDAKQPQFVGIENAQMKDPDLGITQVTLNLRFFNPNSFNAKIKHAQGEAWMDSTYIGPFVVEEKTKIPANSEFVVPVILSVDLKKIALQSLMFLNKKEIQLKATGTLKVSRSIASKTIPFKYEGMQDLQKIIGSVMKNASTK